MKTKKFKKLISLLVALTVSLSMIPGAVWAESSSSDNDFAKSKCIISEIDVFGGCEFNIMLKMENNLDADGYMLYRSTSKNGKYRLVGSDIYPEIADVNVKKGKVYYYKARAYKKINGKKIYSKYSTVVSKRAVPGPVYIENIKVSESGKVTGKILKNKIADGYYIYYATKKNGPYKLIKTTGKSNLKLDFSVPTGKYQYFFKIKGYVKVNGKKYFGSTSGSYERIAAENKIVSIPNKELEQWVKEAMGFTDLTKSIKVKDLVYCDSLNIDIINCKQKDFTFLKYCVNLTDLQFETCPIEGVDIICDNLKNSNLKSLSLSNTEVRDISPLKKLKQLETLRLNNLLIENFEDLSIITQFPKLKYIEYKNKLNGKIYPFLVTYYNKFKSICDNYNIIYNFGDENNSWIDIENIMDDFIQKEITPTMSDYEKIKAAHDFICKKVTYAYPHEFSGCKRLSSPYCPLIEGHGVCSDYAVAFGYLTARMGFETYYVHGYGSATLDDHAWNIIKLDGNYYHVDCTWDDPTWSSTTRYNYFLKSDNTLRSLRDYKWDTDVLPACPTDY